MCLIGFQFGRDCGAVKFVLSVLIALLAIVEATPILVKSKIDRHSWNLPGGEYGAVVDHEMDWVQRIEIPALSARDSSLPGQWRGILSVDSYGLVNGGEGGLLIEAFEPRSGKILGTSSLSFKGERAPRDHWAPIASSSQGNQSVENVFDGDLKTDWHSQYSPEKIVGPHWVGLMFGEDRWVRGLRYVPRQEGFTNGVAKDYQVEIREKNGDWKKVAEGRTPRKVADEREGFEVNFKEKYLVQGVRFVINSDWSGGGFGTAGELSLLDDPLPPRKKAVEPLARAWIEIPAQVMSELVGRELALRVKAVGPEPAVIGEVRFCRVHESPTQKLLGRSNGGLGPDKLGAGLLGFDALIEHQQTVFTVMNVHADSATAHAGLRPGDVVVSINGRALPPNDLNPGWKWFYQSHEALLGRASEAALKKGQSSLSLGVLRKGEVVDLEVVLRRQREFTTLDPRDDAEAAMMLEDLIRYLEIHQRQNGSWGDHPIKTTFAALALLSTGKPKHEIDVKRAVDWAMEKYSRPDRYGNLGFWFGGYLCTLYSEWYLQTGDQRVLPFLSDLQEWALDGQHQSKWNVPALGHGPDGLPYDQKSLVAPSCHLLLYEALAMRCGVKSEIWELLLPYMTLAWSDPKEGGHGALGYNQSYKDEAEFWFRSGCFAMTCHLRDEKKEMESAMIDFMMAHHPWIRNSHAYGEPGGAWGLLALNLCAPDKFAELIKEYAWWFSLAWEPEYGLRFTTPHMGAPYMGEDELLCAAYALVLQAPQRSLHLTGQSKR